jgi:hypothetical protein
MCALPSLPLLAARVRFPPDSLGLLGKEMACNRVMQEQISPANFQGEDAGLNFILFAFLLLPFALINFTRWLPSERE